MKISIRRKITIVISLFLILGGSMWYLNYHKHHLLNQKLQILEKKDDLLNTILESRRYEKNYFLYLEPANLEEALSYAKRADEKLSKIIRVFGRFTRAKDLGRKLEDIRKYEQALATLLGLHRKGRSFVLNDELARTFSERQERIRALGRKITVDMERMLVQEREYVNRLVRESRVYHLLALVGIVLLSFFVLLFLIFNVNRPLKSLEDAIRKISEGDYKNIPSISKGDEFESLVTSLNHMLDELKRRSEQLVQSEKMASLGTLTSGVAHELNNPLNNISTSIQILLEELEEGDLAYQRELLTETEGQIQRARDIVKALLEFSRERTFTMGRVRFRNLVDDTLKLIKGELPANVDLRVDVPEDIEGDMDARRIQQVLINLILNGIQAMPDGGVLNISACVNKDIKGFCFEVQDTGQGIPKEQLSKIFDPFFTTKDVGKGSGLGLSVSLGIIEQHGGRIQVESEEGNGTTFTVSLPGR